MLGFSEADGDVSSHEEGSGLQTGRLQCPKADASLSHKQKEMTVWTLSCT